MFWYTMGIILSVLIILLCIIIFLFVLLQIFQNKRKFKHTKIICICGTEYAPTFFLLFSSFIFSIIGLLIAVIGQHKIALILSVPSLLLFLFGFFLSMPFFTSIYISDKIGIKKIFKPIQTYEYCELSIKIWVCNLKTYEKQQRAFSVKNILINTEWVEIYLGDILIGYFNERYCGFENAKKRILKRIPKENLNYWRNDIKTRKEYKEFIAELKKREENQRLGFAHRILWTNSFPIFLRYLLLFLFKR